MNVTANDSYKNRFFSRKEIRYDRQLRLWGENGQCKLENTNICLLNASVTGSEILKSLILPGIGSFSIIDHRRVIKEDLESNFFLQESSLGCYRAEAVRDLLAELNPDVHGTFINEEVDTLCENNDGKKKILDNFDMIIGTDLNEHAVLNIGQYLAERSIPFLICKTYGLMAYLRLVLPEHHVIEAHPDFLPQNFQLDRPFPALKHLADSVDLDSLNHEQHSHVPFLILLLKAVQIWVSRQELVAEHFPRSYADKMSVKKILLSLRMPDDKGNIDEENFREAANAISSSLVASTPLPDSIQRLFDDDRCNTDGQHRNTSSFWTLCQALRHFVQKENDGALPLRGDLPDMTSKSSTYLALQKAYFDYANKQARRVFEIATNLCVDSFTASDEKSENGLKKDTGSANSPTHSNSDNFSNSTNSDGSSGIDECLDNDLDAPRPHSASQIRAESAKNVLSTGKLRNKGRSPLTFEETRVFCKNAPFLRVIQSRTLAEEYCLKTRMKVVHSQCYSSDELDKRLFDFYVLLRACERFQAEKGRYPGTNGIPEHLDQLDLLLRVKDLAKDNQLPDDYAPQSDLVEEMCRYGAAEIHVVASLIGGIAAQEVIKIVTGQYVPLDNTFIYDGNTGAGKSFEF